MIYFSQIKKSPVFLLGFLVEMWGIEPQSYRESYMIFYMFMQLLIIS
jgi:hypothetical protein